MTSPLGGQLFRIDPATNSVAGTFRIGASPRFVAAQIEGGCLCGAIRYRIEATIIEAAICHCLACRRAAGAQSVAWLTVPATGFSLGAEYGAV